MRYITRCMALALIAGWASVVALPQAGFAQSSVTIVVNGQQVYFDQPPVERAGRVFVPLRGVFERLGASVVYSNGEINATGNGRDISLHLGSTQATVNGQTQYLDVAPFLIGARTLVPLRFVAQALGASVNWDANTNTVRINGSGVVYTPAPNTNNGNFNPNFSLLNESPTGVALTRQPTLRARFSEPVQRDTVRVRVDGADMSSAIFVNVNGFNGTVPNALAAGAHRVRVSGLTQAGARFATGWTFVVP